VHAIPLVGYPINPLSFIAYLLKLARLLDNNTKTFLKYLFHPQYIVLYILIQINEGIAKLITLMVEGKPSTIIKVFKCNTCINL
jgi:hypothetical protein